MIKKIKNFDGKGFTCPECKQYKKSITQWQTCSVGYEYTFENEQWEQRDIEGGDHEAWACPDCGEDILMSKKMEEEARL